MVRSDAGAIVTGVADDQPGGKLTVQQAAERLQASEETVRRWLRDGKIRGTRPGGKRLGWRIPLSEIRRLLSTD